MNADFGFRISEFETVAGVERPPFESVPLARGLAWSWESNARAGEWFRFEEKMDGQWHARRIGRNLFVGELMASGLFYVFDVIEYQGQDLRQWQLKHRVECLDEWLERNAEALPAMGVRPVEVGNGGEFLRQILARGGEGIVAKSLEAPWGATWFKCKRVETFDLVITEKHSGGKASVRLGDFRDGGTPSVPIDRGWCACRREFDRLQVGDAVEVAAFGLTARGLLREPRFIRIRPDKSVSSF